MPSKQLKRWVGITYGVYVVLLAVVAGLLLYYHYVLASIIVFVADIAFILSVFHTMMAMGNNYQPTSWPAIIALVIIVGAIVLTALGKITVADLMALITLALNILYGKYGTSTLLS
ncbi:MAG: hypothetical protein L7H04_07845 [Vulcanisaeta sp.]|nr:hypothetical protein [Vulcanisaeta sp.]